MKIRKGDKVQVLSGKDRGHVGTVISARPAENQVIVDGAHTFAHFDFNAADLDCDYYASSLHKWLCAPHGTGLL